MFEKLTSENLTKCELTTSLVLNNWALLFLNYGGARALCACSRFMGRGEGHNSYLGYYLSFFSRYLSTEIPSQRAVKTKTTSTALI